MDYKITSLLICLMLLGWQIIMWKKIKLPKWIDYILSAIIVTIMGWFLYLTFLS